MNCNRVYREFYLFIDNEFDSEVVASLTRHLAACPECARRLEYTRKVVFVVRERCVRQVAPERLRVRIQATLRGAASC